MSDPVNDVKAYWSTLNKIITRNKVTNIPPSLESDVFIINYLTKADVFNEGLQNNAPCFLMIVLSLCLPQNVIKFYQVLVLIDRKFYR